MATPETASTAKSSFWICTLNNPTDDERALLANPPHYIEEIWGQDEKAPTTGTLHIQLGIRTTNIRKSQLIADFPRMWIGKANSKKGLMDYVSKEETSVPGTKFHYERKNRNNEGDEPICLPAHEVLDLIAQWVNDPTDPPDETYQQAISDITMIYPELAPKLCGTRILPMWNLLNLVFLNRRELRRQVILEEPDSQTYPQGCWLDWCPGCDKDECLDCEISPPLV
nr:MAG: replication associated protein [Cressdnaviricota sp.]